MEQARRGFELYPAHAGVNRRLGLVVHEIATLPRTRGGEPGFAFTGCELFDSTPHTRG